MAVLRHSSNILLSDSFFNVLFIHFSKYKQLKLIWSEKQQNSLKNSSFQNSQNTSFMITVKVSLLFYDRSNLVLIHCCRRVGRGRERNHYIVS